jgi:hypothetical protein
MIIFKRELRGVRKCPLPEFWKVVKFPENKLSIIPKIVEKD